MKTDLKTKILGLAFLTLLSLFVFYLFYSIPKIGYIRNKILIEKYDGVKESRVLYNKKITEWQNTLDTIHSVLERDLSGSIGKPGGIVFSGINIS